MRKIELLAISTLIVAGLSIAASAYATLPEFLPGNAGEKFTASGGVGLLEISALEKVSCLTSTASGENVGTSKKEATATVTFKGCSAFGIAGAKSLGEAEGTIVAKVKLKLCYINKTNKEVGELTKISFPVHIEVAGKLLVVEGDQVSSIGPPNTKTKTYTLTYMEGTGKPDPEGCEGEKEHFVAAINEGAFKEAGEETTETISYAAEQTLDA
ncbi:MAG TPA: hypothetical protein VL988_09470 [Solirubrobacteraceae bacterium]|nr:hypothetical protein [Solirubrobacteraceae bacterium]HUA74971.1 hypothetical protein [Solirubrobacteraceae bacterium]